MVVEKNVRVVERFFDNHYKRAEDILNQAALSFRKKWALTLKAHSIRQSVPVCPFIPK